MKFVTPSQFADPDAAPSLECFHIERSNVQF
jgi:hypothetical protein